MTEEFYRPLSRLRLPAQVRFVAGFVHESRNTSEHQQVLGLIEDALGRRVDVGHGLRPWPTDTG